ncbi:hypothetical protein V1478_012558, partial [Vespula squamosa]
MFRVKQMYGGPTLKEKVPGALVEGIFCFRAIMTLNPRKYTISPQAEMQIAYNGARNGAKGRPLNY